MLAGCGSGSSAPADASITHSTSSIVGAGVLGNTHKPEQACGELAPLDPGMSADGTHLVAAGSGPGLAVPNDPQRVVVVGQAPLDTLCALGLQDRVVALTPSGAPELTPRYLGQWVSEVTLAGADGVADIDAIRAANPDVIISGPGADSELAALQAIAPTVVAPASGGWQQSVVTVGDGVGRGAAIRAALAAYDAETTAAGVRMAASQTEVSMLRFTPDGAEILGVSSLPGQVFTELGLSRPASQRFNSPTAKAVDESNLSPAEGDVMYVAFQDKNSGRSDGGGDTPAVAQGSLVMDSDAWRALGVTAGRTMVVDDGIWVDGGGLIAARLIVQDIQHSL